MTHRVYIHEWESLSFAGDNDGYRKVLFADRRKAFPFIKTIDGTRVRFGAIDDTWLLSEETLEQSFGNPPLRWGRGNRIAASLALKLQKPVLALIDRYGEHRVGIIIGTSVAGMTETEAFFLENKTDSRFRDTDLEMFNPVRALSALFPVKGPCEVISTACTSSTKALASAARLIKSGVIDAALCGGMDAISRFTLAGFGSLGALSSDMAQPFGEHRDGINLAEGGALFILSREPSEFELAGWGETSDAYHISSPDPQAIAVKAAMQKALEMGQVVSPDYVCAHGTGTVKNDEMEALAIHDVSPDAFVSSTKAITGHTLGGAGALSVAATLLAMREKRLPANLIEDTVDPHLATIRLMTESVALPSLTSALCNSFAFGGNNAVLLIKRVTHATD